MMKTSEKIKQGLEHCNRDECLGCPYREGVFFGHECIRKLAADALDYIKKLENCSGEIAKMVAPAKPALTWISCKEILPGLGVRVLALDTMGGVCDGEFTNTPINGLVFCNKHSVDSIDQITHWTSLPEPPKGEYET